MNKVRHIFEKINVSGTVRYNEPMSRHTSFEVGGPCDVYVRPDSQEGVKTVVTLAAEEQIPLYILGGGANILVSDRGIPGIVLHTADLREWRREKNKLFFDAGVSASAASEIAAEEGLAGLSFIYSMPGSIGGSLWMNARCYGKAISDTACSAVVLDEGLAIREIDLDPGEFAYKKSPFQNRKDVILSVGFELSPGDSGVLWEEMRGYRKDREAKGHFAAPSAGSVFKNNRRFGRPTGKIIDSLGLRGYAIGGAKVSDLHANIIVNSGTASAEDILELMVFLEKRVKKECGVDLEREILLAGDWYEE